MYKHTIGIALFLAFATGCAINDTKPSKTEPPPTPPPYDQAHLHQIGLEPEARSDAKGAGVLVAVLDTGQRVTHEEFGDRVHDASGTPEYDTDTYTFSVNTSDGAEDDVMGHGTHVASLALGGNVGVAPEAELLALRTRDENGRAHAGENYAMEYALDQGAKVVNISAAGWHTVTWDVELNQIRGIADEDAVLVVSAGNEDEDLSAEFAEYESTLHPEDEWSVIALDYGDDTHQGVREHYLLVGAVDQNNDLANFSNRPGANTGIQERFLVAPGVGICGADDFADDEYGTMDGTSQATPIVSGAAAVVMSEWPHLGGDETADILLTSADRSFEDYDPEYHGQGMLDMEAALQPIGTEKVVAGKTVESAYADLAETRLQVGSAFGDALAGSSVLQGGVVLDDYERDFAIDLSAAVVPRSEPDRLSRLVQGEGASVEFATEGGWRIAADYAGDRVTSLTASATAGGLQWTHFVADARTDWSAAGETVRLLQPLGYEPQATGFRRLAGTRVRAGRWFGRIAYASRPESRDGAGQTAEMGWNSGAWRLGVRHYLDQRGLWGAYGEGAFQVARTATTALHLRWDAQSGPLRWFGVVEQGRASVDADRVSLLREFDGLIVRQGAAGVTAKLGQRPDAARIGLVYSAPLRVAGGSVRVDVPTGRDIEGNVLRETERLSLAPSGREQDLELFAAHGPWRYNVLYRHEPGHISGADAEVISTLGGRFRF